MFTGSRLLIFAATQPRARPVMHELTPEGQQIVTDAAQRHRVSVDAVLTLLRALVVGHGTMAQFNHPELGGMGQWTQGGMTMVGSLFDHGLKARVDALAPSWPHSCASSHPLWRRPARRHTRSRARRV